MSEPGTALFAPGDRVRARAVDPAGHTRLPCYARGRTGRVLAVTGSWPLADDVARGRAEPRVEPVYTVVFAARDLWGEGGHEVTLDLWQSYLERVPDRRAEQLPEREPEQEPESYGKEAAA